MEKRRHIAYAGVSVAMVLLTAACGSGEDNTAGSANVQPAGGSQTVGAGTSASAGAGATAGDIGAGAGDEAARTGPAKRLTVEKNAELGSFVTDSEGWTLYRFDEDTPKPAKSTCNDDCATKWPAVPADDATATAGIDSGALGSVTRSDGTQQLTLAGWPVYRFAGDTQPGDTKGQGVGGTWNALAPDGKPAGKAAATDDSLQLMVRNDAELGKVIVDGDGMTVYRFDKDSAWPMKTGCLGACLDTWKPVKAVDTTKVAGVDAAKITSFKRPDGTRQAAFDCWLLYTFTGDEKPGDTNGQGVKGTWFAVTDKGKKAGR
ncbi:SCO0930 family lipoprotein [Streptomyces sp. S465]|uniref:SCO0930 family lipoprotein n=1 Tax=Streptomyces sp. S465 TaxID=2979468 RepID=UPI0022A82D08|nr:SCO0930 family lipoprotein [Streptomyces sp. S465]WAP54329.1 SCO0930 family lipoprotein [Streptomyces sp. S465]